MPAELIISVSGLRGIVGDTLTPAVAVRYARAFAAELGSGPLVIGCDGRASGPGFAQEIGRELARAGIMVQLAGVASTPTVGILVREQHAAGGIQISASHNPPEYNGMKLFGGEGRVIPASVGQRVLERFRAAGEIELPRRTPAISVPLPDVLGEHLQRIAHVCDYERIRRKKFRVVLDANRGSGGALGRLLLERLGCQVTVLGEKADGQFEHPPEPTAGNLATVFEQVTKHGAAIGFCQDPDADRLAIIDEQGRYLGEEYTLALCVDHVLRAQRQGPIVTNCSTSRMSEDLAAKYGVPFFRSKVGEANVVDRMLAEGAVLGGEGNGGAIDPRVGLVRDSFVGMALVLDAMAARELPVSALAAELPRYEIHKTTIAVDAARMPAALDAIERHFADATPDRLDGLRLDWPDGAWLLVRPSNTEPIVRAIAEARSAEQARMLCERTRELVSR